MYRSPILLITIFTSCILSLSYICYLFYSVYLLSNPSWVGQQQMCQKQAGLRSKHHHLTHLLDRPNPPPPQLLSSWKSRRWLQQHLHQPQQHRWCWLHARQQQFLPALDPAPCWPCVEVELPEKVYIRQNRRGQFNIFRGGRLEKRKWRMAVHYGGLEPSRTRREPRVDRTSQ